MRRIRRSKLLISIFLMSLCLPAFSQTVPGLQDKKADFYLKEMEKLLIKSRFYPSTMGMPEVANKSRYPNDNP